MLAGGSQGQTLGGRRVETCAGCCRSSALEIGTRFTTKTQLDWLGIGSTLWTAPVSLGAKGHLPRGYIEDTLRFFKQFTQKVSRGYMLSSFTMYPPL